MESWKLSISEARETLHEGYQYYVRSISTID